MWLFPEFFDTIWKKLIKVNPKCWGKCVWGWAQCPTWCQMLYRMKKCKHFRFFQIFWICHFFNFKPIFHQKWGVLVGFEWGKQSLFQWMLVNEMGLKWLVVVSRVVQGSILVIWCHFYKMSKMSFLMEVMARNEGIELECYYYRVRLGQVYDAQKWIYFWFIPIYIWFMAKSHFVL